MKNSSNSFFINSSNHIFITSSDALCAFFCMHVIVQYNLENERSGLTILTEISKSISGSRVTNSPKFKEPQEKISSLSLSFSLSFCLPPSSFPPPSSLSSLFSHIHTPLLFQGLSILSLAPSCVRLTLKHPPLAGNKMVTPARPYQPSQQKEHFSLSVILIIILGSRLIKPTGFPCLLQNQSL